MRFSKGIFMKKFLRKDTYIILRKRVFVNRFWLNLQKLNKVYMLAKNDFSCSDESQAVDME